MSFNAKAIAMPPTPSTEMRRPGVVDGKSIVTAGEQLACRLPQLERS